VVVVVRVRRFARKFVVLCVLPACGQWWAYLFDLLLRRDVVEERFVDVQHLAGGAEKKKKKKT
jgi:hypothetical protein